MPNSHQRKKLFKFGKKVAQEALRNTQTHPRQTVLPAALTSMGLGNRSQEVLA